LPDDLPVANYVCYLFFYLTFLAGPIQRYQEFSVEISRRASLAEHEDIASAVSLVIRGYFRFAVLAAVFFLGFEFALREGLAGGSVLVGAAGLAACYLAFAGYLYLSFAGYTDVMRGFGIMAGFRLPENFDRPFASQDFLSFWGRWHITLSDWFKIYVFNPAVKELISATGRPKLAPYLAAVGYFLTFFLMGLWHGTSWRFILYGLCLGAGVSFNKLFQTWLTARLGKARYAALARTSLYAAAARALALTYFLVALAFFWVPAAGDVGMVSEATIGAGLVLVLTFSLALAADRTTSERLRPMRHRLEAWRPRPALVTAAALAAVLLVLVAFPEAVPPLLYQFF
jgi:D-alanyl-lipoteichoic acid acyltransferase DltB (MBOAT superfamily)